MNTELIILITLSILYGIVLTGLIIVPIQWYKSAKKDKKRKKRKKIYEILGI
jgi:hypothetical protein